MSYFIAKTLLIIYYLNMFLIIMSDFECNNDSLNLNVNHQKSKKICDDVFDAVSNDSDRHSLICAPELITKDIIENHMTWLD